MGQKNKESKDSSEQKLKKLGNKGDRPSLFEQALAEGNNVTPTKNIPTPNNNKQKESSSTDPTTKIPKKPVVDKSTIVTPEKDKDKAGQSSSNNPQVTTDAITEMAAAMTNLTKSIGVLSQGISHNIEAMNNFQGQMHYHYGEEEGYEEEYREEYDESHDQGEPTVLNDMNNNDQDEEPEEVVPVSHPKVGEKRKNDESSVSEKSKKRFLQGMCEIAQSSEPKGPKIDDSLAGSITVFMRTKPDESKVKELFEGIHTPENCPGLDKVTVNEGIWSRLPQENRSHDLKLQRVQTALVKGCNVIATVADKLYNKWDEDSQTLPEDTFGELMTGFTDAFKAFGSANFELVMRRREAMKPAIASDYNHLCSSSVAYTDKLFGDDVNKKINDMTTDNRVTSKAVNKFGQKTRGRGRGRGRGFIPRGGRGRGRGRGRGFGYGYGRGGYGYGGSGYRGQGYNNYYSNYEEPLNSKGASKSKQDQ